MQPRRISPVPFFIISLSLHLVLFFPWTVAREKKRPADIIPVAFIPSIGQELEERKPEPSHPAQREIVVPKPEKRSPQKQRIARKVKPTTTDSRSLPDGIKRRTPESRMASLRAGKKGTIVRRPLPSLEELLPPAGWSVSEDIGGTPGDVVRLDSQDPKYVSYLTSIKHAIELVWEYPDPALSQGVQGKLVLKFTVLGNGRLMETRLIRSSGFSILDEEAIRAVRGAAPFRPIPSWIGKKRLDIIASFEYLDNRLRYSFAP